MPIFGCWFCGQIIERDDIDAVAISLNNLWRLEPNLSPGYDPDQTFYAHSVCAKDRMAGAKGRKLAIPHEED